MTAGRAPAVGVALAAVLAAAPAAALVLGGGLAGTDCRLAFGGVEASAGASGVVCTDGDPACDGDGVADGTCRFAVSLCVDVPASGCDRTPIGAVTVGGLPLAPPPLDGPPGACGTAVPVDVPLGQAAAGTTIARGGGELRDVDYLSLCCPRAPGPLVAAGCALAVDLDVAACPTVPAGAAAGFARARTLVGRAAADGGARRTLLRTAARALRRVRRRGRRLARRDACGYALALVASHALAVVRDAAAATR